METDTDSAKSKTDGSKAFTVVVERGRACPRLLSPPPALPVRRAARENTGRPLTFEFHISNDLKKKKVYPKFE